MGNYFDILTRARDLAPHGYCLLWQPELIWTHVIGDALIAAAYFSIPIAIVRFVTGRKDIEFSWIFWLFALFIVACGTTHLMAIWTLWNPDYGWEALIKVVTAIASVGTAMVLWPLIPRALAIPSPLQLREANAQLFERVRERDSALERLHREIQDRERAEAALIQAQKMDAVGQLTGGIAHDFNNLLAVVIGNLDMIGRKSEDERTQRLTRNALQAAERGARLTGQLLAFSRTQRLEVRPTEVGPLVEGLRDLLRQTLGPSIELELEIADAAAPVLADPTQLELAILNLAINARDAMPEGGKLRVSTRTLHVDDDPDLTDGDYLELSVLDTGSGMTAEVADRAFDPFFTTKEVGQGTGLGLSMVYGVAKQSGGVARIRSAPGEGTTVSVVLPRTHEPVPDFKGLKPDDAGAAPENASVLVVDDEPEVRRVLAETLQELGHRVTTASNGQEALAQLEAGSFDLLMLDFAMPGMNGAQVAEAARRLRHDQKLVFVTGYAETAAIEAAAREAPILRKPFRTSDVAHAIKAGLRERKTS
ncbi:MAG TPA: ATP-binding protein [Allosphingosinicella sp.]|jgi:signal transduction histidine kinase/CheY-like chemotaxis protein|uniref:ATP-binding protein n=1 Tax=Allosphingosinicella sp. TaxID=2823234 RepID=UPI002F2A31FE